MANNRNIVVKEIPKILIVDDRKTEREILSKLLSKFKIEIHTADSGQAALSLLIRHSYILVLLDIQMPIMDGIETATLMRGNSITEHIPVIFLTAYNKDEIDMLQGYKIGAIDYIFKPINEDILSSKVETFLRSYSFEKEKEYEKILFELERKNQKLNKARIEAIRMMKEATKAKLEAELSRKKVEEQTRELMRHTKELEQFAYVATHDLRAPIINLNAFIKIFKKRGYETEDNKELVKKIDASVERINDTLQDLIQTVAYKKTLKDEIKKIDFNRLLRNIEKDIEVQIKDSNAKITYDFREAPNINYIPGHLRSILLNLLTNSINYRADDRRLIISVRTSLEGDYLCLKVKDNGIGIDETKKEKVFGLFQRLSTTTTGKGMGLYIVRSLVESLGGSIDFTSKQDQGAEFKVYLKDFMTDRK